MFNIPTQRLAKVTVTETTSAVTLSVNPIVIAALSFTPRHLVVRVNGSGSVAVNALLRLNGDTGANYNQQRLSGIGSSTSASRTSSSNETVVAQFGATLASVEILLPDALSTRSHKSGLSFPGDSEDRVDSYAFRWASTAAITSVTIFGVGANFTAGSTFELCVVDESFNIDQDGDGEQILAGNDASIDVSSITGGNGDLVVIGNARCDHAASSRMRMHFNGDTTQTNYNAQRLTGYVSAVGALSINDARVTNTIGGDASNTDVFTPFVIQVANYADGSNDRTRSCLGGYHADSDAWVSTITSRWNNTAAITSFALVTAAANNFVADSIFSTYAVPKNLITRTELASAAATVTFADIPQTYDHLELVVYGRSDEASTSETVYVDMNADTTTANYDRQLLIGTGSTVTAAQSAANRSCGRVPGDNATANVFGGGTTTIYNYTKTDRHKHRLTTNGTTGGYESAQLESTRWESTSAVTSLTVRLNDDSDFMAGSVFTLRGIHSTVAAATSDVAALNGIAPADIEAVN